ncbi:phage terminase large subunit [Labrys portucalensis]|uniref:Phage terminase large subunit n=1 Tax=Labrys neptuniae TaxID=376174 RepID=A0ABV6Z968_9HYPH
MSSLPPSNLSSLRLPPPAVLLEQIRKEKARRKREAELQRLANDAEATRQRCKTFAGFVKEAWPIIEPNTRLIWGWELQAMCDHLEAITLGKLHPRLIINVPPGSSKSTIVSVLWQAWEWGPMGMRSHRFVSTSYETGNVTRDTRKTRNLILSEWYQTLWPEVRLNRTGETSFENTDTGFREGAAFKSLTGKRGRRLLVDDPHSVDGAESEKERASAVQSFLEGGLNRIESEDSAIVVVMQRLHDSDLTGTLLARNWGFLHLRIPMEFEVKQRCETPLPWRDPRSFEGELMNPLRFTQAGLVPFKAQAFVWAGQYQQRPVPREGGLFKRSWFDGKIIDRVPAGTIWVRHWDLAATKGGNGARTAGVKMGRMPNGSYVVGHVRTCREDGAGVRGAIKQQAEIDGKTVKISLPQDPGQAGKVQVSDYATLLAGWTLTAEPETGDKITRAEPFAAQCKLGNVYLLAGEWVDPYLDELCLFPGSALKDQVDASSGAFGQLVRNKASGPSFGTYGQT